MCDSLCLVSTRDLLVGQLHRLYVTLPRSIRPVEVKLHNGRMMYWQKTLCRQVNDMSGGATRLRFALPV